MCSHLDLSAATAASLWLSVSDSVCYHRSIALRGIRIGEALHPGPDVSKKSVKLTFCLVNPTSVANKHDQFDHLIQKHAVSTLLLAETSATEAVQKTFAAHVRKKGLKSIWSSPVPPRKFKLDDEASLRGKSCGVSFHSSLPCRAPWLSKQSWIHSTRLLHTVLRLGTLWIQVVVLYGFASNWPQHKQSTDQLFREALALTEVLPLPTMFIGDFNLPIDTLAEYPNLQEQGFVSLDQLHQQQEGFAMPWTCKGATRPDNALMHPTIANLVTGIRVDNEKLFDVHSPVVFSIEVPSELVTVPKYRFPESWISFGIDKSELQAALNQQPSRDAPENLQEWGQQLESLVDTALCSLSQAKPELELPTSLPRSYRGRCQPVKLTKRPVLPLTKNARHGSYHPENEPLSFRSRKLFTQYRRVESLCQKLKRTSDFSQMSESAQAQLQTEWKAICRHRILGFNFYDWCQQMPELGPCPASFPTREWLEDLKQLLRFHVDAQSNLDIKHRADILKMRHAVDVRDGHSKQAFATVRGPGKPCFSTTMVELEEIAMPCQENDCLRLYLAHATSFVQQAPVFVEHHPAQLLSHDEHSILVKLLSDGFDVTHVDQCLVHQTVHLCDADSVGKQLTHYWNQFWLRDEDQGPAADVALLQQDPTGQLLWNVLPRLDWNAWTDPHTVENWEAAIRHTSANSSPGVDGITFQEMRALPSALLQQLIEIVNACSHFPAWFMLARTVPLAKKDDNFQVSDSRPITILASIYRIWSRVSCHALVQHFAASIPREVTGLLPQRGAFRASYYQQWALEVARAQARSLQGITLDLRKCFNLLRRSHLLHLFKVLGFPADLVTKWFDSLRLLTRYWDVGGHCSTPVASTTGCPEGDAWSVISMVLVCHTWVTLLKHMEPTLAASAYADNWTVWGVEGTHRAAIEATQMVCTFLGLEVDWAKTWLWSTDGKGLDTLRRVLGEITGKHDFAAQLHATDLGSPMTYRSHAIFGSMVTRFDRAKKRLHRLQQQHWSHEVKLHMVRASVYPAAFYGVELVLAPVQQLDSLRTQVAHAILGSSCRNANSAILLHVIPKLDDPHLHVVLQALKQAKYFLSHATCEVRQQFLNILASHSSNFRVQGPASALREYLARVGVSCDKQGFLHGLDTPNLNLCNSAVTDLTTSIAAEWEQHLLLFNTERKDIGYMLPIDAPGTARVLSNFTGAQRLMLLREVCGAFQTFEQKSKWDSGVSSHCPWCPDTRDTRLHRVFDCCAFASLREESQQLLEDVKADREWLGALPALRVSGQHFLIQQLLHSFPAPVLQGSMRAQIHGLYGDGTPCFFTDGSCAYPDLVRARFASYGVVVDIAVDDCTRKLQADRFLATGTSPDTLVPLAAARLTGRQCIHRAEMTAVLWVFQQFAQAHVYTDSQDTHDWILRLQADPGFTLDPLHPDVDLLRLLQQTLGSGHRVSKIKAHQDCAQISNLQQCYLALGNRAADTLAGETNKSLYPEIAKELWDYAAQYQADVRQLTQFYSYLLRLAEARRTTPLPIDDNAVPSAPQPHNLAQQLRTYAVDGDWTCPSTLCEDWLSYSIWGYQVMEAVQSWVMDCQWPQTVHATPGPVPLGISWVEITIAVVLRLGMWLPVIRRHADGYDYVVQPLTHTQAQQLGTCLGEQAWLMAQIFHHFQSLVPQKVLPPHDKGKVLSLTALGFDLRLGGLSLRPAFSDQATVIDVLLRFSPSAIPTQQFSNKVCRHLGGLPEHVVRSDFAIWPEDMEIFSNRYEDLKRAAGGAQTAVLRRRKSL
eukprot:Skav209590  [mRNA]  locus=scaffold1607:162063:167390:- [translate_table: standard]